MAVYESSLSYSFGVVGIENNKVRYLAAIFIQLNPSLQREAKSEAGGVRVACIEESFLHRCHSMVDFHMSTLCIIEFFILKFWRCLGRSVPGSACWTCVHCFISHPEDGTSVSTHAGVETYHDLYFRICIFLHFLVNTLKLKNEF